VKVLITGASGFIGIFLCLKLREKGHDVLACSRSRVDQKEIIYAASPELGMDADWTPTLSGIDVVVHLAGRAHVASEKADAKTDNEYLRINAEGTRALAEQSSAAGVKHFIYLSSCHAVASESAIPITKDTKPHPVSAYGRSKLFAEQAVDQVLSNTSCYWTILRPPLVYGPGNKANFGLLIKMVKTGVPLPLGSVRNLRSFIYVENLVDVIIACLGNPKAFGKTYLPTDGEDVSTPELISKIAKTNQSFQYAEFSELGAGRSPLGARRLPLLFPFPESILKALGRLPGLGALRKLTSSLYVDSEPVREDLGWIPRFTMEEGLRRTIKY
jgi:nucleoside-diphosphate-sugar epimerase